MCLIAFAWQAHPDYPLVVLANRDEFFARPTLPADWWPDTPGLLAGRDLQAGGTWMGLTRRGRFAALTNYRDPSRPRNGTRSRGLLVCDALLDPRPAPAHLAALPPEADPHAGYNLLVADCGSHRDHAPWLGVHHSIDGRTDLVEAGVHALSNHALDTPWPKLLRLRKGLADALDLLPDESAFAARARALLTDRHQPPDTELPDTGVGLTWERQLAPAFVRAPGYGTRSSALILVNAHGHALLREWTWNEAETPASAGERQHRFTFDAA